jgi:hypothetical protein
MQSSCSYIVYESSKRLISTCARSQSGDIMKIYGKLQLTGCFVYLPYRIIFETSWYVLPAVLRGKTSSIYNSMVNETTKQLLARTETQNEESHPLKPTGHIDFGRS